MESPHRSGERFPTKATPETSPERSVGDSNSSVSTRSLPYRLKRPQVLYTPESSPDRGQGGVRLSPNQTSMNENTPRCAQKATEIVVPGETDEGNVHSLSAEHVNDEGSGHFSPPQGLRHRSFNSRIHRSPNSGDTPASSSSIWGLKGRSLTNSGRLHIPPLSQSFVAEISGHSPRAERTTLDGAVADDPTPITSETHQENRPPLPPRTACTAQSFPQEPPSYEPRPLNAQRSVWGKVLLFTSSHRIRGALSRGFRLVWLDLLFLLIFSAITGIILLWGDIWRWEQRRFPMTFDTYTNTWYGPVELSYPQHEFILGITMTAILIPLIPLAVIMLTQIWIRSLLDFNAAFFALKKAMVLMYAGRLSLLFQQLILTWYQALHPGHSQVLHW